MIFGVPFSWLALREAYRASQHRWAVVWELDEDFTARARTLTVDRVEPWVAAAWVTPDRVDGSVDRG